MDPDKRPLDAPHSPAFFEQFGERVMLLVIGPMERIPQLYQRGRLRFAMTRGASYATVMLIGLFVMNLIAGAPIFRAGVDSKLLLIRFASYWFAQFLLGSLLSLFLWRMVRRIAEYKARLATERQG